MDKNQALTVFLNHLPASGEVDYVTVENAMRSTPEGRQALRHFHQLRRSGALSVRVNREIAGLSISRPSAGG